MYYTYSIGCYKPVGRGDYIWQERESEEPYQSYHQQSIQDLRQEEVLAQKLEFQTRIDLINKIWFGI